jgi:hypothetical protein
LGAYPGTGVIVAMAGSMLTRALLAGRDHQITTNLLISI